MNIKNKKMSNPEQTVKKAIERLEKGKRISDNRKLSLSTYSAREELKYTTH